MIKIAPSALACDFSRFGEEILAMENAGADMIHLDVMDGVFVPNISFGAPVIKKLRRVCSMPFDVHLMITDPLRYISDYADAGAGIITFHLESNSDTYETIRLIRSLGLSPGVSIKPKTRVESLLPYLSELDSILVMTVEPGFGGQSFMRDMLPKISKLVHERERLGLSFDIQVDGGIDVSTAKEVCAHGANSLVAGSSLYGTSDYVTAVKQLRENAQSAFIPETD